MLGIMVKAHSWLLIYGKELILLPLLMLITVLLQSFDISEPDSLLVTLSSSDPSCEDYTDGQITVSTTGASGGLSYLWNTGDISASLTGLAHGFYTVTVKDANDCPAVANVTLQNPAPIVVYGTTTDNQCYGENGGISHINQTNGSLGMWSYAWSNGDTTSTIANLYAGSYSVLVTNSAGCYTNEVYLNNSLTTTSSIVINDPDSISVTSTVSQITVAYANDGVISIDNVLGGTAPYAYSWIGTGGYTSTGNSISGLNPGIYTVTVTDDNGCQYFETFSLSEPQCNVVIALTYLPPLCHNDNAQEVSWYIDGGNGPYTSTLTDANGNIWYGPSSGLNPVSLTPANGNAIPPGLYNLQVYDASGTSLNAPCYGSLNIPVINPDPISVDFSSTDILCFGESTGSLSAIASGGTVGSPTPYDYAWANGQTSFNISGLIAGSYICTVTDANNCSLEDTGYIYQPSELIINSISSTLISCDPGVDGTASVVVSGGVQPYQYEWPMPNFGISQTTQTATYLSTSGNYIVNITDDNGCSVSSSTIVSHAPTLSLTSNVTQPLCYGDSNGVISAIPSGGTAPYSGVGDYMEYLVYIV